jgi:hypothetical protein
VAEKVKITGSVFSERERVADYPDSNGNGIPDVFENRLPLVEILNADTNDCLIVEIEKTARPPKKGEWFICGGKIEQAEFDYGKHENPFTTNVIRKIIAGQL